MMTMVMPITTHNHNMKVKYDISKFPHFEMMRDSIYLHIYKITTCFKTCRENLLQISEQKFICSNRFNINEDDLNNNNNNCITRVILYDRSKGRHHIDYIEKGKSIDNISNEPIFYDIESKDNILNVHGNILTKELVITVETEMFIYKNRLTIYLDYVKELNEYFIDISTSSDNDNDTINVTNVNNKDIEYLHHLLGIDPVNDLVKSSYRELLILKNNNNNNNLL